MKFLASQYVLGLFTVFSMFVSYLPKVLAEEYIPPTEIPSSNTERARLVAEINEGSTPEEQKVAYLAELALLTSSTDTQVEEIELLEVKITELKELLDSDPELNAALGSTISFRSSFYTDQLAKLSLFSRKGNRIMDRAVKQAPFNLGARLQRGISCANMPAFLRRARYAVEDLELVQQKIGKKYGEEFQAFVEFYLAQAYSRNKQKEKARNLWTKLTGSETNWAQRSRQALEKL
ncbi:hypothetical protein [Microbulbifer sp. GL-2]|uniref:hypothetical protein n=1 Tax=Microbulbifer sp. GL-2 TaxID=2591606 RepID=UPI0011639671|nr:hypothetical protein [Microbulbifer sp. GL-2]BBM03084.1 hypothetical protein GL2_31580 [Microbulbifer sp. GL-2]